MKNYIVYALFLALSLPVFFSCSKDDDGTGPDQTHDRITFALTSEAPVAEYPGTQVSYTFTVEYPAGLSQIVAMLDGKEIENSKQIYEDAPVSVTYDFRYTLLASQSGQTVDFVFKATGADGYEGSIDYPVYVFASQADVDIELPDDAPTEVDIFSQTELAFNVKISAAAGLMKIRTLKNGEAIEALTKTEGFTSSKTDVYAFEYKPTAGDVGQTVTFTFEVTDNDGNLVTSDYAVKFIRAASTELDEYYGINVGLNRCTSYGPFLDADACKVYTVADGYEKCADIDIVLFWSNNPGTQGLAVCGANMQNASTIYNAATITDMGGVAEGAESDVITNWPVRNATLFKTTTMTVDEYASVYTRDELVAAYENCTEAESGLANMLNADRVVVFKTVDGRYGIMKVVSSGTGNKDNAVFDYKIEKKQ